MAPMTDLSEILANLDVEIRPEAYVFLSVPARSDLIASAAATVTEAEGTTVVLPVSVKEPFATESWFAWLSLTINSSLEAIGLTAAFSTALAAEGISRNVLAGFHHDHLLVAWEH